MIVLPIIQAICFLTYIWIVVSLYGILPSISQSWYSEGPTKKKFMFIAFIVSISIPTMLLFSKSLWFLASGGSLLIVAFAPSFRSDKKIVGILHSAGTIGGIAFACYALLTHGIYFPTICCLVGSILLDRFKVENSTWWVEIADFTFIVMGVFQLITLSL
jgi:hypothetical protein